MKKKEIRSTNELIDYLQNELKVPLSFSERHDIRYAVKRGDKTIEGVIQEYKFSETKEDKPLEAEK